MATPRQRVGYGLSDALLNVFPAPIVAKRNPTSADIGYQIGQSWIVPATNAAFVLTSVVNNSATWSDISGAAGSFSSLTVNPGPTNLSTVGNGAVTIGNSGNTGAITINTGTGNFALNGNGNTIGIGNDAAANSVTVGSATGAALTVISGGTAGIVIDGAAATPITIGAVNQTALITLGQSTAANSINIGNAVNTGAQVVNISSGASGASSTVNILNGAGSAGVQTCNIIGAGATQAGIVNIGTGAAAHAVTIGSTTSTATTIIKSGSTGITLTAPFVALPGPVYIYTGAGVPSNALALHVGDLYINTTAASATTRMYIATAASTWTNITCAA